MPGMYLSVWNAIFMPKGTPKDAIAKLNTATVDALADPNIRQRVIDMGLDIPPREQQTPEALGAFQKAETEKWWPIVKAANFKGESLHSQCAGAWQCRHASTRAPEQQVIDMSSVFQQTVVSPKDAARTLKIGMIGIGVGGAEICRPWMRWS